MLFIGVFWADSSLLPLNQRIKTLPQSFMYICLVYYFFFFLYILYIFENKWTFKNNFLRFVFKDIFLCQNALCKFGFLNESLNFVFYSIKCFFVFNSKREYRKSFV